MELQDGLLAELNRQLDRLGLIVKRGTLVDATIISAAVKVPAYEEGTVSERDPDAGFTAKNDKTYFGYKAHLGGDEGSGLIRQAEMSSADLHDVNMGKVLIQGDEQRYFADKAYDSQDLRDELAEMAQSDGRQYTRRHRADQCHDEELVRHAAGPLSRPDAQSLPSADRRLRHEHQAGAGSAAGLSGSSG